MNQAESLSIKVIARLLKEHGLKQTRGRIEILRILLFANLPISQAEIVEGLGQKSASIHRASIYRNLIQLKKLGIVHEVEANRYVFCKRKRNSNPHFFLYCAACNKHMEIEDDPIADKISGLLKKLNFLSINHSISFRGICLQCLNGGFYSVKGGAAL